MKKQNPIEMKPLTFILLSFAISLCCVISCSKEGTTKSTLEGNWGLVYSESYLMADGEYISEKQIVYCDPYNPTGDHDLLFSFHNLKEELYLVTIYLWDGESTTWRYDSEMSWRIKGNTITFEDDKDNSEPRSFSIISLSEDTFTFERNEESNTAIGRYTYYNKYTLKKMRDLPI